MPVLSGVPQGSVLGPLLFLIYIDGINGLSLSPGSNLVLYADDMLLYRPISSRDDYTYLQADICSAPRWLRAGMAIGRRAQNARNIRAKRVNYRTLINAIARS